MNKIFVAMCLAFVMAMALDMAAAGYHHGYGHHGHHGHHGYHHQSHHGGGWGWAPYKFAYGFSAGGWGHHGYHG